MRKNLLVLFLAFGAIVSVYGQYLPHLLPLQQIPCPFDPSQTVTQPTGWRIYQTLDGHWNGPIDSNRCISATLPPPNQGGIIEINLEQINPAKPVFLRALLDVFPPSDAFEPNLLYNIFSGGRVAPGNLAPLITANCPDDLCSGVLVGIAIPDENGQPGAALRMHTALLEVFPPAPSSFKTISAGACFPTERFEDQILREYILKYTFPDTVSLSGGRLWISTPSIDPSPFSPLEIGYVTEVQALTNPVSVEDISSNWGFAFLGLYTAPTYPGPQALSYIEAAPVPNTLLPQNITLTVGDWQTLEMQPFAQFRGGLVAGSDSVRHQFTLENNGGDLCLNFLDLIFDNGDALHHAGGQISMNNAYSCMQFKNGSEIRVKSGATLHYGRNGAGMLVICANSTIALEPNATLVVDAILQISECDDNLPPHDIYMDLPPGARLIFTKNAWLTNRFSKQQQMHLNVRMLGGTLDDAALPPDSRALIRRIYPEPVPNWGDNVQVAPNPFSEKFSVQYLAGADEPVRLRWLDVQGRLVREETLQAAKGSNVWNPQTPLENGLYFLEISAAGGWVVRKVCKQH